MAIFQDGDDFKVITGSMILAYNGAKTPDKKGKYSVKVLVPKTDMATISEIEQLVSSKAIPAGLNLPPYFSPGHQHHDGDYSKHEHYRGYWVFNAGTQFQPGIIDANGAAFDPNFQKLYAGCVVQIVIHAFPYGAKDGSLPGVSLGLDAIKVIDNTTPEIAGGGGGADAATLFNQGVTVAGGVPAVVPVAPVAGGVPAVVPVAPVAGGVPAVVPVAGVVTAGQGVVAYDVNGNPVQPAYDFNKGGQPR